MSQKRFFIGGVEVKEGRCRDYVLHLIDLVSGRFYRFKSREEVGEIVACLCSPGYANSIREECLTEAREGRTFELPISRPSSQIPMDDADDFAHSLHEMNPQALTISQELERLIKEWEDLRHQNDDQQTVDEDEFDLFGESDELFEDAPEEEGRIFEAIEECSAFMPYLAEDHDFGSGPLFDFERDFTFKIEDIPEHLREKYRIISFETAKMAAIQFDQVKSVIDHALEDAGIKKPTPKEVVPAGRLDCGCQDDALAFEGHSFMKAK